MGVNWEDLLDEGSERVLPWFGYGRVHNAERTWTLSVNRPSEHGWYRFQTEGGRTAHLLNDELQEIDPSWADNQPALRGYLVGNRFIPDNARVDPDPDKLVEQTTQAYCVEPGLNRFARASVVKDRDGHLVYTGQEFPQGPEAETLEAYQNQLTSINEISGVTPALDLAFRWVTYQREQAENRRIRLERIRVEEEKKRAEQERVEQLMRDAGTAVGRRALAAKDFNTAAREALRISGAELLDTRESHARGEMIVQYRFRHQRLECVVDKTTLKILDAGICLTDESTGFRGDSLLTLESLPPTVGQAIDQDVLVIYRHV